MPTRRGVAFACMLVALGACNRDAPPPPPAAAPTPAATDTVSTSARSEPVAPAAAAVASESRDERRRRLVDESRPVDTWQPELAPVAAATVAERLQRARDAMLAGRIESGEDNALSLFLAVQQDEPGNVEAEAGIAAIAQALHERVDSALSERRYADAVATMPLLRKLRPDDAAVAQLDARVELGHEIAVMLADAQRLAAAGKILEPAGDNAAAAYAEVLQRDPGDPTALSDLARLEAELVAQATAAAEAGDYARSDRLLADGARLRPGSGTVQDASTRIVEMRQGRAGELLQQAHDAAAAGDVARAEQLLGQLEQVSVQSQGIEELRLKIDQARIYGGFAPGQRVAELLTRGGRGPEMVVLPAGRFEMGSARGEDGRRKNEGPQHTVTFARGFAIARTETTVAQFRAFVEATGYRSDAQKSGRSTIYDERTGSMAERGGVDWRRNHAGRDAAPELPVVHVSWNDAKAFADWLSRETGESYRLASESEFEYALRAGAATRFPWGDALPARLVANLTGDRDVSATRRTWSNAFPDYGDGYWGAAPVGSFDANRFGLHDVDGNVSEWVDDCWHDTYSRAPGDGSSWVNPGCEKRAIRGASWASAPDQARAAFRISAEHETCNARVGFRVARDL